MSYELERAYVFGSANVQQILAFLKIKTFGEPKTIIDEYINKNLRIRTISSKSIVTRKTGDKSNGCRNEYEHPLSKDIALIFTKDTKLSIVKRRYQISNTYDNSNITLDIINKPMNIAILEIESTNDKAPPTAYKIFKKDLIECPLSAWDLFKQKIGICGAPSCGKTETAKTISGMLSTQFGANAFYVLEYATSFIQKYDLHPSSLDQFILWHSQKSREDNAALKANIVISDCPTFLSYIYMMVNSKNKINKQFRIHLTKLYKRILEDLDSYSRIIYLRPYGLTDNNIRFHTNDQIRDIANRIHSFLKWHNVPHIVANRDDEQKIINSLFYINPVHTER